MLDSTNLSGVHLDHHWHLLEVDIEGDFGVVVVVTTPDELELGEGNRNTAPDNQRSRESVSSFEILIDLVRGVVGLVEVVDEASEGSEGTAVVFYLELGEA